MDRADHLGQPVTIRVAPMTTADAKAWVAMREALWPSGGDHGTHDQDVALLLAEPGDRVGLMARDESGEPAGFAEASLRHDYVNGCDTSPVAFLEGIYVAPAMRRRGGCAGFGGGSPGVGAGAGLQRTGFRCRSQQSGQPSNAQRARLRGNPARRLFPQGAQLGACAFGGTASAIFASGWPENIAAAAGVLPPMDSTFSGLALAKPSRRA
jgi:hypothetical protein